MKFTVIPRGHKWPDPGVTEAYLRVDYWNDYQFVTMFDCLLFDENGTSYDLGSVKIGFDGQTTSISTYTRFDTSFESLSGEFFSIGQDVSYYRTLGENISSSVKEAFLRGLNDVVFDRASYDRATGQQVFKVSLLRSIGIADIDGQFRRVVDGGAPLTDYNFSFGRPKTPTSAAIELAFLVSANSTPSTNIHALIGRNGVGKTTLLNEMIATLISPTDSNASFYSHNLYVKSRIDPKYFSAVVSVSFSAFDPFNPPQEQIDPEIGPSYFYVGLKNIQDTSGAELKSLKELHDDCLSSLDECFSDKGKRERWRTAIATLESDENFARMKLSKLAELPTKQLSSEAKKIVERMSSGHAIVLLTISRLVAKVSEKTLVLLDEPESHLHPPLLSAFTRALSELLRNRNGVAIIATHSPVVLQEVPKSCAWVLTRSRLAMHAEPPRIETFGENVGVLTREVFGLEVTKSGFHALLQDEVTEGKSYDTIVSEYNGQVGLEARGILRAMIAEREAGVGEA